MPADSAYHAPVLVAEVAELLADARTVLDCTVGVGGHSLALLERGAPFVMGIDRDGEALAATAERLKAFVIEGRFGAIPANYADLDQHPLFAGRQFEGILIDLGVSSHQ